MIGIGLVKSFLIVDTRIEVLTDQSVIIFYAISHARLADACSIRLFA